MRTSRLLLVLSVGLNAALAISLGWQLSLRTPVRPEPESTPEIKVIPLFSFAPALNATEPPKITVGGDASQAALFGTALSAPIRFDADEFMPSQHPIEVAGDAATRASLERQRDILKRTLLQVEPGEFQTPNVMYQIPPRLDLKPGRSTPFSTPHWDRNPVLRHRKR